MMNKRNIWKKYHRGMISMSAFFLLWEISARIGLVNELFVSHPSAIFQALLKLTFSSDLVSRFLVSFEILFSGLFLAIIVGFFGGILIGSSRRMFEYIKPFIFSINMMPTIAIMPLLILWFGIGYISKIFIVFLLGLAPIIISTIDGVHGTKKTFLKLVRSFGGDKKFITKNIFLYSVLRQAFSGLKIAIGRSIIGIIIADLFGVGNGIGYLVSYYGSMFQTANLMVVLFILFMLSLTLTAFVNIIEEKLIYWE